MTSGVQEQVKLFCLLTKMNKESNKVSYRETFLTHLIISKSWINLGNLFILEGTPSFVSKLNMAIFCVRMSLQFI